MGAITKGFTGADCSKTCPGGIRRLWVANQEDVISITFGAGGEVDSYVMDTGTNFYEIKLKVNTKQLTEDVQVSDDGCTQSVTQTFEGIGSCWNQDVRDLLLEMGKQSCCGIIVIHEENSGETVTWGFLEDLYARLGSGTQTVTGANLTDPNQFTLQIVCTTTLDGLKTTFTPGAAGVPITPAP
jgi:hypothetical protein